MTRSDGKWLGILLLVFVLCLRFFGQPCQQISKWCCIFWETLSFQGIMFFQGVVLGNLCLLGASIGELRPGLLPIISCIFCFRLNKALKNLTSLHQHHLQYTGGLAETRGLLLPSLYCDALYATPIQTHRHYFSSYQNFIRDYCSKFEQLFLSEHFAFTCL